MTTPCPLMYDPIGRKAVELLIELAQPRRLWLFGSRARNQHGEGSDYDFALEEPLLKPDGRSPMHWKLSRRCGISMWSG
jgi:hypothetical protein